MMELKPLDEMSNKRTDPRCETISLYLSLYEIFEALELKYLLEADYGSNNILKHQEQIRINKN